MRLLNASTAQVYNPGFTDDRPFDFVGTGGGLLERVELVRAALPDADRGRFELDRDGALDSARLTGNLGRLGDVVEGWWRVVLVRERGGGR